MHDITIGTCIYIGAIAIAYGKMVRNLAFILIYMHRSNIAISIMMYINEQTAWL